MHTANKNHFTATGRASLVAGFMLFAAFLPGGTFAQELEPNRASERRALLDNPLADWGPDYTNWVEISIGGVIEDRAPRAPAEWKAEFQRRRQIPADIFGGIESLHYEDALDKKTRVILDGRSIFDNHDYDVRLELNREDLGYVRAGFREFRTWYDRHGGFYPIGSIWLTPFDREASIDRGEIFFEAGLRKKDVPEITFRYSHQYRDGTKDSTSWGDYNLNIGRALANNPRNIVPSFWDIDETRDIFAIDARHSIGAFDVAAGVRYELIDQDNSLNILRRPGEVPPVVTRGAERRVTQNQEVDTDLFNAHASAETRFNDNVLLTMGAAFTTLETELGGSRTYGAGFDAVYDPLFGRRQQFDEGFLNLNGGSRLYQYLVNLNLQLLPFEYFTLTPSIRVQQESERGDSRFIETNVGPGPTFTPSQTPLEAFNDRDFLDVTEALEARYTGFSNWVLYARGQWTEDNGNLFEREANWQTGARDVTQDTESDRFTQKYVAGLNWYPLRRFNLAGQYYHKIHNVNYENRLGPPPTAYPAFLQEQDFETDDMNIRATVRPLNNLTFVARYDFQLSTIDTAGDSLGKIQSAEVTSHIMSGSASWTPIWWLYLQGNFNYALDETETPANHLSGAARNLVLTSHNDYWNASALAGIALDDKTDLQLQYYHYRADNYQTALLAPIATDPFLMAVPYGAGAEENGVTATLIHQLTSALRLTLKYGFFTNHDETYGVHTKYEAHVVYSSLQYRF